MASLRLTRVFCRRLSLRGLSRPAVAQEVIRVHAQAPGWNAHTDLSIPITHHELRLSLDATLADRRGVRR